MHCCKVPSPDIAGLHGRQRKSKCRRAAGEGRGLLLRMIHRVFLLCCCLISAARAGQVNWSSAFGGVNLTSGGARMDGQMVFELGVFLPGFTPTAANAGQWSANWRRAQLALYQVELAYFTGVHPVTSNAAPFTVGAKGYIWGHDGNCTDGEGILMSSPSWTWPSQSPLELPVNWTVSAATQFTVGQGNGAGFQMQSARVSAPLPATPWAEWRARAFNAAQLADPNISGPGADPDHDSVVNLAEFALGGHPLLAGGAHGRITPGLILSGGRQRLTMTVTKRCDRTVLWSGQASLDLAAWPAASVTTLVETAEVLTVMENLTSPADSRAFLRPVFQLP